MRTLISMLGLLALLGVAQEPAELVATVVKNYHKANADGRVGMFGRFYDDSRLTICAELLLIEDDESTLRRCVETLDKKDLKSILDVAAAAGKDEQLWEIAFQMAHLDRAAYIALALQEDAVEARITELRVRDERLAHLLLARLLLIRGQAEEARRFARLAADKNADYLASSEMDDYAAMAAFWAERKDLRATGHRALYTRLDGDETAYAETLDEISNWPNANAHVQRRAWLLNEQFDLHVAKLVESTDLQKAFEQLAQLGWYQEAFALWESRQNSFDEAGRAAVCARYFRLQDFARGNAVLEQLIEEGAARPTVHQLQMLRAVNSDDPQAMYTLMRRLRAQYGEGLKLNVPGQGAWTAAFRELHPDNATPLYHFLNSRRPVADRVATLFEMLPKLSDKVRAPCWEAAVDLVVSAELAADFAALAADLGGEKAHLAAARALRRQGLESEALKHYRTLTDEHPDAPEYALMLGYAQGEEAGAQLVAETNARIFTAQPHRYRAIDLLEKHGLQYGALEQAQHQLWIHGIDSVYSANAMDNLVRLHTAHAEYAEAHRYALALLDSAVITGAGILQQDDFVFAPPRQRRHMGYHLLAEGDSAGAEAEFAAAMRYSPRSLKRHLACMSALAAEDEAAADRLFEVGVEIYRANAELRTPVTSHTLSRFLLARGYHLNEALEHAQLAVRAMPSSSAYRHNLANIHLARKEPALAYQQHKEAIDRLKLGLAANSHRQLMKALRAEHPELGPPPPLPGEIDALLADGKLEEAERVLYHHGPHRKYVALAVLTDSLDRRIETANSATPKPWPLLTALSRAKGDLRAAHEAAEKTADPRALQQILMLQGDHEALDVYWQNQPSTAALNAIQLRGYQGIYARLTGDNARAIGIGRRMAELALRERSTTGMNALAALEEIDLYWGNLENLGLPYLAYLFCVAGGDYVAAHGIVRRNLSDFKDEEIRDIYRFAARNGARSLMGLVREEMYDREFNADTLAAHEVEAIISRGDHPGAVRAVQRAMRLGRAGEQTTSTLTQGREGWWKLLEDTHPRDSRANIGRFAALIDARRPPGDRLRDQIALCADVATIEEGLWGEMAGLTILSAEIAPFAEFAKSHDSIQARMSLAGVASQLGHYDIAVENYRQAQAMAPESQATVMLLAAALQAAGKSAEAEPMIAKANLQILDNLRERRVVAQSLSSHGYDEAAAAQYRLAWQIHGPVSRAFNTRFAEEADSTLAARLLQHSLEGMLQHEGVDYRYDAYFSLLRALYQRRAEAHLKAGDTQAAAASLAEGFRRSSLDLDGLLANIATMREAGGAESADRLFELGLSVYRSHSELNGATYHNNLAWYLARNARHLDEALKHARIATQLAPNQAYLDTLAEVHHQRGEHAEAYNALKRAYDLAPYSADAWITDRLPKFAESADREK